MRSLSQKYWKSFKTFLIWLLIELYNLNKVNNCFKIQLAPKAYLSTSSLAIISPFFRALIANNSLVFLYSAKITWYHEKRKKFFRLKLSELQLHPLFQKYSFPMITKVLLIINDKYVRAEKGQPTQAKNDFYGNAALTQ